MMIFYKVALKLIRSRCMEAHAKSMADDKDWMQIGRNLKVSAAKREVLEQLLLALESLPTPETDQEGMTQLQQLLIQHQDKAVAVTTDPKYTDKELTGSTEKILGDLAASLPQMLYLFDTKLHLLNQKYNDRDALMQFYLLTGLYHSKRTLRAKEVPEEQGRISKAAANVSPFITAQKVLVKAIFELCSRDIQPWDERASRPDYQSSRAREVLAYVHKLQAEYNLLIAAQSVFVTTIPAFAFHRDMLNQCLAESILALEALWGINGALQSKILARMEETDSVSSEMPQGWGFDRQSSHLLMDALPEHVTADFRRATLQQDAGRNRATGGTCPAASIPALTRDALQVHDELSQKPPSLDLPAVPALHEANDAQHDPAAHLTGEEQRLALAASPTHEATLDLPAAPAHHEADNAQAQAEAHPKPVHIAPPADDAAPGDKRAGSPARILYLLGGPDAIVVETTVKAPVAAAAAAAEASEDTAGSQVNAAPPPMGKNKKKPRGAAAKGP